MSTTLPPLFAPLRARPVVRRGLALLPLALACLPGFAVERSQADLGSTGVMVSSCGGLASGSFPIEGGLFDWQPGQSNCTSSQTTTPGQVLSASDSFVQASPSVQADAHGTAQYGSVGTYAHFVANASAGFAAGETTAGWTDTLVIMPGNPAQMGQNAVMNFSLHLDGVLDGQPMGNSYTRIGTQVWMNNSPVYDQSYRAQGQGQGGFPFHLVVDQTLNFSVNVVLGTPFELGIFTRSSAGTAGAGPDWFSEATSDFASTLTWQGIGGVSVTGIPIDYSLSSESGIDWQLPFAPVPEPATWLLMSAGVLGVALRRRPTRTR